jgi:cupin fold WbuC family metalloprotein
MRWPKKLRAAYDFHEPPEKVQRFLNALQPGTYVRPHRHLRDAGVNGFEFFLVLQGSLGLLILDEQGQVIHTFIQSGLKPKARPMVLNWQRVTSTPW